MKTREFDFKLPNALIAQRPLNERDNSRLMVLDKITGEIKHNYFYDIVNHLNYGDCLVLNDTRVLPARLIGQKEASGGRMEFLLLKRKQGDTWEALARPGKRARIGNEFIFGGGLLKGKVIDITKSGTRILHFQYEGIFEQLLDKLGIMPLPPYITETLKDRERYQTIYSKHSGSVAAPTAGLHFTGNLLNKLVNKGVEIVYITLHVGLGTFSPVKVENIQDHKMHSEFFLIDDGVVKTVNNIKSRGGKIIAVGTTSCRALESAASQEGKIINNSGWTDIFIYPGYKFKIVDKLITNFHLPKSTLLMLVSALCGRENILQAYNIAITEKYRFFSFGDAMFIK